MTIRQIAERAKCLSEVVGVFLRATPDTVKTPILKKRLGWNPNETVKSCTWVVAGLVRPPFEKLQN